MADMPWTEVEPLPVLNGDLQSLLDTVRAIQGAWKSVVAANDEAFHEARRRSLRRHAIETGIIERLYDIDWGVTEALVAEGLTADAVARVGDGSVNEDVLEVVRSQYETLEFLVQSAREGRDLSVSLIKELHVALTRRQPTYTATGPTGMVFQATLHHGEWKQQVNHVTRPDGSLLEYTPPEQVASQMDRLVELYRDYGDRDPIVQASWLHHRFVRIHPFEDGNGRVARCLTLLILLKHDLAPLVVDRRERTRYLQCLDRANEGDLRPLVRFFAELEIGALRSELERPVAAEHALAEGAGALTVLEAGIGRLRELRSASGTADRSARVGALADGIQQKIHSWLEGMKDKIGALLREGIDNDAKATVVSAAPPSAEARYWRRQVIRAARSVDFYTNLREGVWWTRLHLVAFEQKLRYLVFLQKTGIGETGVLTLTVYAEMLSSDSSEDGSSVADPIVESSPTETVTWTWTHSPDDQWATVVEVLDTTLASALAKFTSGLG
ncbi:Fic/DOC family protein [Saccharothrix saharensis]|uniref:Fic/DOC family protein n=1 Tax=Saccharothrix saharensis TaxID=571190 RepID=A0A543JLC6_9PSEU|nr:Fic family protein [Saccharothrix saharensis]TQM83613.1 Fic/DOC family protein [Saccharothrix saharensis]